MNQARNQDIGLLFLRASGALFLLWVHGLPKLLHYSEQLKLIEDPFHLGASITLLLAIFAEVLCPLLILAGVLVRLAWPADSGGAGHRFAGGAPGVDAVRRAVRLAAADHLHQRADRRARAAGVEPAFCLNKKGRANPAFCRLPSVGASLLAKNS